MCTCASAYGNFNVVYKQLYKLYYSVRFRVKCKLKMHGEGIFSLIFHCSPKGGKIKPHLLYRQTRVGKI